MIKLSEVTLHGLRQPGAEETDGSQRPDGQAQHGEVEILFRERVLMADLQTDFLSLCPTDSQHAVV